MKTDAYRIRIALLERLRRFEWDLARDEQARSARQMLRGKVHDLLNFVQIVDLGSQALAPHTAPAGEEFLVDLARAAADAKTAVHELQQLAHAEDRPPARTAIAAVARAAIEQLRGAVDALDAEILVPDAAAVAWTREELELLLIALALDGPADAPIELLVRARDIDGRPCLEIVCGPLDETGVGARLATTLAARIGGDAAVAERRGGGHEIAVAVPLAR